jgi:hypothetical protein
VINPVVAQIVPSLLEGHRRLDAHLALAARTTTETATQLQLVGEAARHAAGAARQIVSAVPEVAFARSPGVSASPSLAPGIVLAVVV